MHRVIPGIRCATRGWRRMEIFKFGWKFWKRNLFWDITNKILSILALGAELLLPLLTAMIIDYVIGSNDPSGYRGIFRFLLSGKYGEVHTLRLFTSISIVFVILLAARIVLIYVRNVMNQVIGLNMETDLRMATFRKLMELDSETLSGFNAGELLTTLNSDTIMFKELFGRIIPNLFDAVVVLLLTSVILARINPCLLIIPVLVAPVFSAALLHFRKVAHTNYVNIRAENSNMSLTVQENIEAVRLVRSFTNEELEKQKFNRANEKLQNAYISQVELSATFEAIFSTIRQIAYIGSVALCAVLCMRGYLLVGSLSAVASYILTIMGFISQLNNMVFQMQQQLVSGQKMYRFLNTNSKTPSGTKKVDKTHEIHIEIEDGSLVLDHKQVLKHVNLDIPFGKHVGIVGGTGSGKSVLLESLVRIHDLTGGRILMNGKDIREYDLESLRGEFSYVFQDVFLFSNTIDSNIAYADPDTPRKQVIEAAKHAQADTFINDLEEGYETIVGERGLGISGGQKQRVAIARALLKNAPVLVLDDSTSALDVDTEKRLLSDIHENYPDRTVLISAHRLSSVVDCDEILYMQDGAVIERGTFDELMRQNGRFAAVYNIQKAQATSALDVDRLLRLHDGESAGQQAGKDANEAAMEKAAGCDPLPTAVDDHAGTGTKAVVTAKGAAGKEDQ
jgi:ABC-type multidrug transport system fused ATPase/permease subunit